MTPQEVETSNRAFRNKYMTAGKYTKKMKYSLITRRIMCRHSILMLMGLHSPHNPECGMKKVSTNVSKCSFFFKPSKSKYYTLLRAPYRYKIARNKIGFKRFFFKCSVVFKLKNKYAALPLNNSFEPLITLNKSLMNMYSDLDTNICTQDNVVITLPFKHVNFFKIKNYLN